jgi:hypothetical protein
MNRLWYAVNALNLLESRRRGMAAEGPVVVSMTRQDGFDAAPLYVRSDVPVERLDWSMLVNLDVWVWAGPSEPLDRVVALTVSIAKVKPKSLFLRFEDRRGHIHDVEIGSGTHHLGAPDHGIAPEHSFLFCPINSAGTRIGRGLQQALQRAYHRDIA